MYDLYNSGNFKIIATRAKFQHNRLDNTTTRIKAMNEVKDNLAKIALKPLSDENANNFLDSPIAYAYIYLQWEANETISNELLRNIGLTFLTIAVVSLILILNLQVI